MMLQTTLPDNENAKKKSQSQSTTVTTTPSTSRVLFRRHRGTPISPMTTTTTTTTTAQASPLQKQQPQQQHQQHQQPQQHPTPCTTKELFYRATRTIAPGRILRAVLGLYAERRLVVLWAWHTVATLMIASHFSIIKHAQKTKAVQLDAPFRVAKIWVPTVEFGLMHAVLFQLALLPLTMVRYTIAANANTNTNTNTNIRWMNQFVPLHYIHQMHYYLGYWIVGAVGFATIGFVAFFGTLCLDENDEDQACQKFTSEIMLTGYAIVATLLVTGITSYLRHFIAYEVFYVLHHLVFLMYVITIAHTFDKMQRSGAQERSQTFKWFAVTLLYYLCDRAAMYLYCRYTTLVKAVSAICTTNTHVMASNGRITKEKEESCSVEYRPQKDRRQQQRMLLLKVKRPALFTFVPGQYAYIRVPCIDRYHWHPFSIASNPSSSLLEFYLEVFDKDTWTDKLWTWLTDHYEQQQQQQQQSLEVSNMNQKDPQQQLLELEVMGPYGTSLVPPHGNAYSHVLAIGTGTGIVPIMSAYQQHVRSLLSLDPTAHFATLRDARVKLERMHRAYELRKGSLAQLLVRTCCHGSSNSSRRVPTLSSAASAAATTTTTAMHHWRKEFIRYNLSNQRCENGSPRHAQKTTRQLKKASFDSVKSMYTVVLIMFLPVLGSLAMGLTISWNFLPTPMYDGMVEVLFVLTVLLQTSFVLIAVFVWDGNSIWALVDVSMGAVVAPVADLYWMRQYAQNGRLPPNNVILYCLHAGYMTLRLWSMTTKPSCTNNVAATSSIRQVTTGVPLERFDLVWVTRDAALISEILPDIQAMWDHLVDAWGPEYARQACRISIFCTSADKAAVDLLQSNMRDGSLWAEGAVKFGRPDFEEMLQDYVVDLIEQHSSSQSVLAFCGSPALAGTLHRCKISTDLVKAITGHKRHQMEFHSESYGSKKSTDAKQEATTVSGPKRQSRRKYTAFSDGSVHRDDDNLALACSSCEA